MPQLDLLKKISDTLGVLGLGELRQRVQQEIAELAEILSDGKNPSEAALVKVAGVLLSVEDSLDDQLVRLILPARRRRHGRGAAGAGFRIPPGQRGGAARMHRQSGAHQGSRVDRRAKARGFLAAGTRQRAAAAARHHRRLVDARQGPSGRADGCDRRRGAQADRARGAALPMRCGSSASPMRSSASSTTWRRCRTAARIHGTCSTTPRRACGRCAEAAARVPSVDLPRRPAQAPCKTRSEAGRAGARQARAGASCRSAATRR